MTKAEAMREKPILLEEAMDLLNELRPYLSHDEDCPAFPYRRRMEDQRIDDRRCCCGLRETVEKVDRFKHSESESTKVASLPYLYKHERPQL